MKNHLALLFIGAAGAAGLVAQNASYTAEAKQFYTGIKDNLLVAAEKMPEDAYGFKPAPDIRTFGQLIAHVADSNLIFCSVTKGEQKKGDAASKTSKADLTAALKESFDYCDSAFSLPDDATSQAVTLFRRQMSKLSALHALVDHDNEMYGTMSVYLRLKGIVPPSTERSTRARQ